VRVLVAFEEEYHAYRDVMAAAIEVLRPRAEVETSALEGLGEQIEAFDPDLVICTRANIVDHGRRTAWIELSVDPLRPTKVCVDGQYTYRSNLSLEALVAVVDEVE
jgi:hypothetical protein